MAEPGSAARRQMGRVGSNGERSSGVWLGANAHNAAADAVSCTDGYESMAMSETHFDDAMMMDYKVMVVLLFVSPADR